MQNGHDLPTNWEFFLVELALFKTIQSCFTSCIMIFTTTWSICSTFYFCQVAPIKQKCVSNLSYIVIYILKFRFHKKYVVLKVAFSQKITLSCRANSQIITLNLQNFLNFLSPAIKVILSSTSCSNSAS